MDTTYHNYSPVSSLLLLHVNHAVPCCAVLCCVACRRFLCGVLPGRITHFSSKAASTGTVNGVLVERSDARKPPRNCGWPCKSVLQTVCPTPWHPFTSPLTPYTPTHDHAVTTAHTGYGPQLVVTRCCHQRQSFSPPKPGHQPGWCGAVWGAVCGRQQGRTAAGAATQGSEGGTGSGGGQGGVCE